MEIPGVRRKFLAQAVIHLIEESGDGVVVLVFQGDFGLFGKGHTEIAVESAVGDHGNRHRSDLTFPRKTTAEEVTQRAFHRRGFLPVPVHAQHQVAQHIAVGLGRLIGYSDPYMSDKAGAVHFTQGYGIAGMDIRQTWASFPGGPQWADGHSAASLFPGGVLGIDGAGAPVF